MSRSKSFLLFCISFIAGIFLGSYFSISLSVLFIALGIFISFAFLLTNNGKLKLLFLLTVFLALGLIRIESEKLNESRISRTIEPINPSIEVEGKIFSAPEIKNGKQKIIINGVKNLDGDKNIHGKIILYADRYPSYNIGDKIKLSGKIKIPEDFDGFEYKNYLAAKGIYYVSYYPKIELLEKNEEGVYFYIANLRRGANDTIKKIFPQPQAGILSAMTLGIKSEISDDVIENFNKTGTRHIVAISGLHMTIVALIIMYMLLSLGLNRNRAFYFALLGIAFFVILAGLPPSAIRAAIMGGLVLLAVKVGRLSNSVNAIVFAACLMLLYNPNFLRYDVGFQLSFSAVLGIIYIFPRLEKRFQRLPDFWNLKAVFLITISAQIATLPIILNNFGGFSLVSVFANVLILPLVPIVMIGGFAIIILGSINLFIAQIVSWPIWLALYYQTEAVKLLAKFPFGYVSFIKMEPFYMIAYYAVLIFFISRKTKK